MIIKKRPIITWLLNPDTPEFQEGMTIAMSQSPVNYKILNDDLNRLKEIRALSPNWGLPELVTSSFRKVMENSAPAFEKEMPRLFSTFSEEDECGILLFDNNETLVYGFGNNQLQLWLFTEQNDHSLFICYVECEFVGGQPKLIMPNSILYDDQILAGTNEYRLKELGNRLHFIALYVAVKKYIKIETVIVPKGTFTAVEGTPLEYVEKKKVINQTGQEVVVMDSKWFRKIVNDNDIPVRCFFRKQHKKDKDGNWTTEEIFIDSYIRHGYHRDAKIEEFERDESKIHDIDS